MNFFSNVFFPPQFFFFLTLIAFPYNGITAISLCCVHAYIVWDLHHYQTSSSAINALTTDVIIDINSDLPDVKITTALSSASQRGTEVLFLALNLTVCSSRPPCFTLVRWFIFCQVTCVTYSVKYQPKPGQCQWLDSFRAWRCRWSLYHTALLSTGVCPIASETKPTLIFSVKTSMPP